MNARDVLGHVEEHLPHFAPADAPERLGGGLLNEVWRVPGQRGSRPRSVIAKHAPPHIASRPEVPLDSERIAFEALALGAFAPGGALEELAGEAARPPRPYAFDESAHLLLMEDVGTPPALDEWLRTSPPASEAEAAGKQLGNFIGQLHARTAGDPAFRDAFDNRAMQETRLTVQYRAVGDLCEAAGLDDAETLGRRVEALGERFIQSGTCFVMGDLWPPSILMAEEGARLIDWELCHYGRPAQDVAHLAAHLWMQAHRAPSPEARAAVEAFREAFFDAYHDVLGKARTALLTPQALADCGLHFGAEILVRALGPFQEGYLYDGLAPEATPVQEAAAVAGRHLREPHAPNTFAALQT